MFAIGLTSGLGSVAYSVLAVEPHGTELKFWEVMPGPRKRRDVPHTRRYNAYRLMFEQIFDRWPPAVIGLGPPSTLDEPIEWVTFMRTAVFQMGHFMRVPVELFDNDQALALGLGGSGKSSGRGVGLKTLVQQRLPEFRSNKRRLILATAAAMAGGDRVMQSLTQEEKGQQ